MLSSLGKINVIVIIVYLVRCVNNISTPRIFSLSTENWKQSKLC